MREAGGLSLLHAHAGIVQQLPVVVDDLRGHPQFHGHEPCIPLVDLFGGRVSDRADQSQGGASARPRLALAAAHAVKVPHVLELVAEGAAGLYGYEGL